MATNNAEVSSQALRGLQDNLNSLSEQIRGICDTLNSDRDRVGEAWRDSKFQEFKQGFQPQIDRCSEISVRYHDWCIKILDPAISQVEKIEQADVVGNGSGSVGGGGAAGAAVGSSAATAATGKGNMFNMGGSKAPSPNTEAGTKIAQAVSEGKTKGSVKPASNNNTKELNGVMFSQIKSQKPVSKLDKACRDKDPSYTHGELGTPSDHNFKVTSSSSHSFTGTASSGFSANMKIFGGHFDASNSETASTSKTEEVFVKCLKD